MGLGKTIQTIALLGYLACSKGIWGPHLIVVPTSVLLNWEMEFKRFLPGFKTMSYYGSPKERAAKRQGWSDPHAFNVCITSYQLALADAVIMRRKQWIYLILDEAHNIKNFKSKRWETLLGFKAHHRLLLTGTPLQNNLMELWSLLYFLMPDEAMNDESEVAQLFLRRQEFKDLFHSTQLIPGAIVRTLTNLQTPSSARLKMAEGWPTRHKRRSGNYMRSFDLIYFVD